MLKKLFLALAVLIGLILVGWQAFESTPARQVQLIAPTVQSLSTTLELNSIVVNDQIVTITALLDGEIGEIRAREGDAVKSTQTLALLDNKQAKSVLAKAQAELEYRKQKLNTASRSYTRVKDLSNAGSTSRQNLDDALDKLRSSQSEMAIAEADITLAELQIDNTIVRAPFDGIITEQLAESGQWIEAATPMFTLVAKDGYLIEAQVDASDWTSVTTGQTVTLTTDSSPEHTWESNVSWIASRIDYSESNAKAVAIRFPFGDDAPPLLLGQEIDATLILEQADDALTLPLVTMVEHAPNSYGVFIAENDTAVWTPVEVGLINATHAQVISGLKDGDKVIEARGAPLEDGMSVAY